MDRFIFIKQEVKGKSRRIDVTMDPSNERYSTGVCVGADIICIIYKLFADDANPLKTNLQHDIDRLSQWSEK